MMNSPCWWAHIPTVKVKASIPSASTSRQAMQPYLVPSKFPIRPILFLPKTEDSSMPSARWTTARQRSMLSPSTKQPVNSAYWTANWRWAPILAMFPPMEKKYLQPTTAVEACPYSHWKKTVRWNLPTASSRGAQEDLMPIDKPHPTCIALSSRRMATTSSPPTSVPTAFCASSCIPRASSPTLLPKPSRWNLISVRVIWRSAPMENMPTSLANSRATS